MSDPTDFIAMFAALAVAVAGFTWYLRDFIGKERIATLKDTGQERIAILEERLRLAQDRYDDATEQTQRLTNYVAPLQSEIASLESEVAKLQSALASQALQPQLNSLRDTAALIAKSVTSLSTANNELGVVLTGVGHSAGTGTAHGVSEEVRPQQPGSPELGSPELKTTTTKPSA